MNYRTTKNRKSIRDQMKSREGRGKKWRKGQDRKGNFLSVDSGSLINPWWDACYHPYGIDIM